MNYAIKLSNKGGIKLCNCMVAVFKITTSWEIVLGFLVVYAC